MYLNNFFKIISKYDYRKINIFFLILLIFFHVLVYAKYELNIYHLLKHIVVHIIYIIIPGLIIYKKFFKINNEDNYQKFSFAFAFGILFLIIQYFILQNFHKLNFIIYFNPIFCLVFFFLSINNKKLDVKLPILNIFRSINFFTILYLTLIFLFGSILASPPLPVNGLASYMQDKLYVVGIIEGLLRDFPPPDVRVANENLSYHGYFTFIYLALIAYISNIPNFELYFYLSQYCKIIFFILSLSYFSNFIFRNKKESDIFIFIAVFFSCSSLFYNLFSNAGKFSNENLFSITIFSNGYMLANTFIFLITPEIIKSLKYKSFSLKDLFIFTFFLIMIFGSKAPNAAFIVGTIDLFFIFLLFLKRRITSQLISLVVTTNILFFIFYFLFYSSAQSNYSFEFHIGHLFRSYHPNNDLIEVIIYNFISLFFIPFHQILFYPFSIFISYFYILKNFSSKKNKENLINFIKRFLLRFINFSQNKNFEGLFIFSAICVSYTSYIFWFKFGGSAYFMMIGAYFFSVFSLKILFKKKLKLNYKLKNFLFILILISLASTLFSSLRHITKGSIVFLNTFTEKEECQNIYFKNKKNINTFEKYFSKNNCPNWDRLTHDEYLGLIWIKNNTARNSVILSDRLYYSSLNSKHNARYFYYSTFSERILFLEGFYYWVSPALAEARKNLIDKFYNDSSFKDKKKFLNDNKIDFIIVSNFLNKDLLLSDDYSNLVFKNRDIRIYKVKKN